MSLLSVENLSIGFQDLNGHITPAVRNISFSLEAGQGLALVGESGSGKSVTAMSLARLLSEPPAVIQSGRVMLDGNSVFDMSPAQLQAIRGKRIGYIFQEPAAALNPVFTIRNQIAEVIQQHRPEVKNIDEEIVQWLDEVGIVNPRDRLHSYPHQLSGGMQQRVMIAMALAGRPDLLVADEPTTALDVTIQAQIIELLARLKKSYGMALILITHNLGIIGKIADHVAVMYRGNLVEQGPIQHILKSPEHPYTKALLACVPRLGSKQRRLPTIDDILHQTA
jgi:ABC-type dipeptide/oligopeptide/nickel transport system ATPase component